MSFFEYHWKKWSFFWRKGKKLWCFHHRAQVWLLIIPSQTSTQAAATRKYSSCTIKHQYFLWKRASEQKNIYQQAKIFSLKIEFQSKKIFLLHLYYTIKHQYFLWRASEQENIPLTPSSTDIFFEKELQSYHKWFLIWIVNKSAEKTLYWIW